MTILHPGLRQLDYRRGPQTTHSLSSSAIAASKASNARLHNLKERTLRYWFRIVHVPGVQHKAVDAIYPHPSGTTNPAKLLPPDDRVSTIDSTTPPNVNLYRDRYLVDGVILYKDRVVIPPSLHIEILSTPHSTHQEVTHTQNRLSSGQA